MPLRLLPEVSRSYFEPDVPEFAPRTAWSLHNAFTGAAKVMPMTTRLPAIQTLGKFFWHVCRGRCTRASPPGAINRNPKTRKRRHQHMDANSIPNLPCPGCGVNILDCRISQHLHGDESRSGGQLDLRPRGRTSTLTTMTKDTDRGTQVRRGCHCGSCDRLLPWPLYQIRKSRWAALLPRATSQAAELVASVEGCGGDETVH